VETQEEVTSIYMDHCYPETEQIVRRVREVIEDWVGSRWVRFVEEWEKSQVALAKDPGWSYAGQIGGAREYGEALEEWKARTQSKLKAIYIMTNGKSIWANEVRQALGGMREGIDGVGRWTFRFEVDVDVRGPGLKQVTKKTRRLVWKIPDWPWDLYFAQGDLPSGSNRSVPRIKIATARDLVLSKEERFVGQAVDMYFGQRAELFIGNGVSNDSHVPLY